MNRRKFLRLLGIGATVAAAAPYIPVQYFAPAPMVATIGSYSDYANFSEMSIAAAIDRDVMDAADELGYRAGLSIGELNKMQFDA